MKIEFVAPSGRIIDAAVLDSAARRLAQLGHSITARDEVWGAHQRFASDDASRAEILNQALTHPQNDLVMAARGGYGLTRILPKLNFAAIKKRVPIVVGHSDFTAFHLAYLAKVGGISFAGPMACFDFGAEKLNKFTQQHFWDLLNSSSYSVKIKAKAQPKVDCAGTLWGGNLAVLCSLLGTPYFPHIKRGILFLEDINEHPYRIERMLYQLHYAGVLKNQQAILLGDFSGYKLYELDNGYTFARMLTHMRSVTNTPIFTGLPFGHCAKKITLPVGAKAELTSDATGYQLSFSGYPNWNIQ